jgi:hypothetical protein
MMIQNQHSAGRTLNDDQLRRLVPSAFAVEPHAKCSARYTYIPTVDVIGALRDSGFEPTFAKQSAARTSDRREYTKHMIRFRPTDVVPTVGGLCPEIALVNSHDGSSAYQLFSGLFRYVCTNGLLTGDSFEAVRVKHKGDVIRDVIDASFTVIDDSRRAVLSAESMGAVMLNRDEQMAMAEAAHTVRFDGSEVGKTITAEMLLHPRRVADMATDVFTTLNVLQENTLRGGQRGWRQEAGRRAVRVSSRAVAGIDQGTLLNRALWTLAERMIELKQR